MCRSQRPQEQGTHRDLLVRRSDRKHLVGPVVVHLLLQEDEITERYSVVGIDQDKAHTCKPASPTVRYTRSPVFSSLRPTNGDRNIYPHCVGV